MTKDAIADVAGSRIYYREAGSGSPLLFLHGGWGYEIYPLDRAIAELGGKFRILIPDRPGYGRSPRIDALPADFHRRAAAGMIQFLDAMNIARAVLWGHSDGAVIAAMMGLEAPERFSAVVLEAFHYRRAKLGSIDFFKTMIDAPDALGERVAAALARDHGPEWRGVLERNATAWLEIARGGGDLYDGKLSELTVPALFLHGGRDPRTEPGDVEAIRRELPAAEHRIIRNAGHSPHSEPGSAEEAAREVANFLKGVV